MNCQEFTSVSVELARGQLLEATTREEATRHADSCARCAARLAREASLTSALRATRAQMCELGANARVETALLAAFRAQTLPPQPLEASDSANAREANAARELPRVPARVATARFAPESRRALWTMALAASLILAFVGLRRALIPRETVQTPASVQTSNAGQQTPVNAGQQTPVEMADVTPPTSLKASTDDTRRRASSRVPTLRRGRSVQTLPVAFDVDGGRAVNPSDEGASGSGVSAGPAEAASEFMALASSGSSAPLEGGQMVRVQLPRSALAAMGLPVSAERANESVQADVLLAHDGTARAIRVLPGRAQVAGLR